VSGWLTDPVRETDAQDRIGAGDWGMPMSSDTFQELLRHTTDRANPRAPDTLKPYQIPTPEDSQAQKYLQRLFLL
jgi:hypothetical protein